MRILYVYADSAQEWNCSQWRALSPADAINAHAAKHKSGHQAKLLWLASFANYAHPAVADIVGPADVIVVQRNCIVPEVWDAMEYWRGLHKAIIVDLDDDYPELPWSNPAHAFWIENQPGLARTPIEMLATGLRKADALTSPSQVILDDWREIVPGLHLPNYARGVWYREGALTPVWRAHDPNKVVIGWGGSVSHYDSWWFSGVRDALKRVCAAHPNVMVKICGNDPRLFEQLDVPAEQKMQQPGVAPEAWPQIVASFDIGLAPLDLREGAAAYDQRRSWIKGLEYMLTGVPWVASRSEPYRDMERYGVMVGNAPDEWADALERVIANLAAAKKQARRSRCVALNWTVEASVSKILAMYDKALGLRNARAGLPNMFYIQSPVAGIQSPDSKQPITDTATKVAASATAERETRRQIQAAAYAAARMWHTGLGLVHNGVPLSDGMSYDVIQWFNRELLAAKGLVDG